MPAMTDSPIIYTYTDEAPALATHSFLPVIEAFAGACGVGIETRDISLAARTLAQWNDTLPEDRRVNDALAELGELAKTPEANIIKLPNISASVQQLKAAIAELQSHGFDIPDYPDEVTSDADTDARARYSVAMGSAVNPVLREGNSDRRAPAAVKEYARNNPHSMGEWSADSKSHVATMDGGDFRSNEKSVTIEEAGSLQIRLTDAEGQTTVLKESVPVEAGEVVDSTFMSKEALEAFLRAQVADAETTGVLFSLHMKATMMKVSDPIIFGHAVRAYFAEVFETWEAELAAAGANPNDGLGGVIKAVEEELDADTAAAIKADIDAALESGPDLAYVNSHKGITNLHVPSDVIIDASMPAMIRTSGQMWNADDETQDTKATIPDSSYADLYQATIEYCKANGAFDPSTMGTVPNVGLMAKKAEEYGSHDKTFEIPHAGTVEVVDGSGTVLMAHEVEAGDIWRACQAKDGPIRDWVKLAVNRARATGWPAIFWLDETRAHDAQLIAKVKTYLDEHDTEGLDIQIMNVADAAWYTLERAGRGENTISVTGNVLRDYLTDLFPILELGTSAKMLSIVPLMNGGGLFETGAGGSAPKHVQQLQAENHLRWDSLGEYLALGVSLEHFADVTGNGGAKVMGEALSRATTEYLREGRSPSRKVNELDNRASTFYLSLYWAQALAEQDDDADLAATFTPVAEALAEAEETIVAELIEVQGEPVDLHGYYYIDRDKADRVMRPSKTYNSILADI